MHTQTAYIVSFFCKDEKALKEVREELKTDHKRVISIPGEIIASIGEAVVIDVQCNFPPPPPPPMDITRMDEGEGRLEVTSRALKKNLWSLTFKPVPHPDDLPHVKRYEVIYRAKHFDIDGQLTAGGFTKPLNFYWPLVPRSVLRTDGRTYPEASGSTRNQSFSVPHLQAENVYFGGQGDRPSGGASVKPPARDPRLTTNKTLSSCIHWLS